MTTILKFRDDEGYKRLRKVLYEYSLSFTDELYLAYHASNDDKVDEIYDCIADNDNAQLASKALSAMDDDFHK